MNVKRIAAVGAVAGVLAAMLAGATTSGRRALPPPALAAPTGADLRGAALAAEVARLRARLRPSTEPAQPARNLFQFGRAAATRAVQPDYAAPPTPVDTPPPAPPLTLVGLATDGAVRTAILSGYGDLFLVKDGEAVGSQYRVTAIGADGVELTNTTDGTTLRLVLK